MPKRYFAMSFLVVLVFAWITWPSIGEVNIEDCNPNGIAAKLSAIIYGDKFWSVQLAGIRDDLFRAENLDRILAEAQGKEDEFLRQRQAELDAIYEKYPSLPHRQLREAADEIKENEDRQFVSEMTRKQVPILRHCEVTIVARLHKPQ